MPDELHQIVQLILEFRDERDWKQFHNPKDLAIALSGEASELLQEYLWKQPGAADVSRVKEELADVLIYSLLIADHYDIDVSEAIRSKLDVNRKRYPVDKSRGNAEKYTRL